MALGFPFGFRVANPEPLDNKYGPHASVAAAKASVLLGERYIGLTVNVSGVEYWWKDGVTDVDLILKTAGSGGGITWQKITTNVVAQADMGYIADSAAKLQVTVNTNYPLKTIRVCGLNTGGWKIIFTTPVRLVFLDEIISLSIESTLPADAVELVNIDTNTWQVVSCVGNILFEKASYNETVNFETTALLTPTEFVDVYVPAVYTVAVFARGQNAASSNSKIYYRIEGGAWQLLNTITLGTNYSSFGQFNIDENLSYELIVRDNADTAIVYGEGQNINVWNTYSGAPYGPFVVTSNLNKYLNVAVSGGGTFLYP